MPRRLPPLPPLVLRAALLAGLVALLVVGLRQGDERPRAMRLIGGAAADDRLASLLTDPLAPTAVLRDAGRDPLEGEIQALDAVADRAPVFVELPPEGGPTLRVSPPDRPVIDRFAAIRFVATVAPGDTVTARLFDHAGTALDSVRVVADPAGSVGGAFRVRPGRPGWTEWRVAVEAASVPAEAVARAGAWVMEANPPRVLVVAGPPSWESRYALRALERSGAEVSLVQWLGRDNVVTAGDAVEDWAGERSLGGYDIVVLLPGAAPDAEAMDALEGWVAGGKGVLAASAASERLGLGSWAGAAGGTAATGGGANNPDDSGRAGRLIRADSLAWTAPAEVAPLPAADLESAAVFASTVPAGATVAVRDAAGGPVLVLAPLGRGRAAGLGLRESWRWVMEAGLEAEHRAFWRSLVDWLAAPSADSLAVSVSPAEAAAGTTVDVGIRRGAFQIDRPGGTIEPIPGAPGPERTRGRFVAVDTGVHALRTRGPAADPAPAAAPDADGHAAVAAFRSRTLDAAPPAELGRARLSLLAAASGGAALEPPVFAARVEAMGATGDQPGQWLPWIFAALALLALAEWTLRRLRALP